MIRSGILLFCLMAACNKDDKGAETGKVDDTGKTDDTGQPTDDTSETGETGTPACQTVLSSTDPEDGSTGWFYRDALWLTFSDDASGATLVLYDSESNVVPTTNTWSDGNFQVSVAPDVPLEGESTYTLHIEVCDFAGDLTFSTSEYGAPLEGSADALVGNTYVLDLSKATILQPETLGPLLASYLTEPLLIGVDHADDTAIGLIGAQGYKKSDGGYKQVGTDVWIFPDADFSENPYFTASTDYVAIDYGGTTIPIEQFELSGTFAPDGSAIGGGHAQGWGDTRNMGPLLGLSDSPSAICDYIDLLGLGVECSACADGGEYCLFLEAVFDEAPVEAGLTLTIPAG